MKLGPDTNINPLVYKQSYMAQIYLSLGVRGKIIFDSVIKKDFIQMSSQVSIKNVEKCERLRKRLCDVMF